MAGNEHIVVGAPRAMILIKLPASPDAAARQLIAGLDIVGPHRDGFLLATCRPARIAALRATGAEVITLDQSANEYVASLSDLSADERVARIEARVAEAREELALADAGGAGGGGDGGGGAGGGGDSEA